MYSILSQITNITVFYVYECLAMALKILFALDILNCLSGKVQVLLITITMYLPVLFSCSVYSAGHESVILSQYTQHWEPITAK